MSMDPIAIAESVTAGLGTHHLTKMTEEATELKYLEELCKLQVELLECFNKYLFRPELKDIYKVVHLYKLSFGPSFVAQHERRQFCRVLAPVPTAVLVTSIIGPSFIYTIPAASWTPFDFPDASTFILDNTATSNDMSIYVRYTNDKPSN